MHSVIKENDIVLMAIRERLMDYFKGWSGDRVVDRSSVRITTIDPDSMRFRYERREHEIHQPCLITLDGYEIGKVEKAPFKLSLDMDTLSRSPELRELTKNIKQFMSDYLPAVEVAEYGQ